MDQQVSWAREMCIRDRHKGLLAKILGFVF
jgi:hypothetical protein